MCVTEVRIFKIISPLDVACASEKKFKIQNCYKVVIYLKFPINLTHDLKNLFLCMLLQGQEE